MYTRLIKISEPQQKRQQEQVTNLICNSPYDAGILPFLTRYRSGFKNS